MPRRYRLGERAVQMQFTRERIVEAAIELYTEQGISATTLRQVGARADVAPGTLRNHFASREDLELAMVQRLTAEAPLPDASIFDGAARVSERVERLIGATGRFLDQAARLYRMWLREPMLAEPWTSAGAAYGARWAELTRTALGPLADDEEAGAVIRAIMEPAFFEGLRAGRRTTDEAAGLISRVIAVWLERRVAALGAGNGTKPSGSRQP
jgi:AcrR family transcriptional regulator